MKPKKAAPPETLGEFLDNIQQLASIEKHELEVLSELVVTTRLLVHTKTIAQAAEIFPDLVKAVEAFEKTKAFKLIRVRHE